MATSTHQQIVDKICEEIKGLELEVNGELSAATDMTTDMKIDSLDVMELVFTLEETFDASVPVNDLSNVYSIGEMATLVEKNMD